jgi:hypothetical protein
MLDFFTVYESYEKAVAIDEELFFSSLPLEWSTIG